MIFIIFVLKYLFYPDRNPLKSMMTAFEHTRKVKMMLKKFVIAKFVIAKFVIAKFVIEKVKHLDLRQKRLYRPESVHKLPPMSPICPLSIHPASGEWDTALSAVVVLFLINLSRLIFRLYSSL